MVFLSIPNGKTLSIDADPSATTISAFELLAVQRAHIPQPLVRYSLRLRYPSRDLDSNSVLLSDLGISRFSTVIVHIPLLGGMQGGAPPKPRLDFLNSKPPSNCVAGLGRGATECITRSDIGPAPAAPGVSRGGGKPSKTDNHDEEAEEKGHDENQKFDEFEGNDEDDKEAEAIWEAIDKRMDSRRKDRREAKLREEIVRLFIF